MNIQGLLKLTHEKNKRANKKLSICLLLYLVFRIPLLFLVPYFNTYVNYVMNLNVIFVPLIILFTLITMTFFTENLSHVFFNNKKIMWLYIKEIPRYIILNLIFLGLLHHIYNFFIDPNGYFISYFGSNRVYSSYTLEHSRHICPLHYV